MTLRLILNQLTFYLPYYRAMKISLLYNYEQFLQLASTVSKNFSYVGKLSVTLVSIAKRQM